MKPPKTPFWSWDDFGCGPKWHLAFVTHDEDEARPTIVYPIEQFEDYWYDEDWEPEDIRPIKAPAPKED